VIHLSHICRDQDDDVTMRKVSVGEQREPTAPAVVGIPRTLVVADKFPPGLGGIQTFTWNLVRQLPADRVVVLAAAGGDTAEVDAGAGVFAGAVSDDRLPAYLAAGDVFALPCRTRWGSVTVSNDVESISA
jgi:hypothetical protein